MSAEIGQAGAADAEGDGGAHEGGGRGSGLKGVTLGEAFALGVVADVQGGDKDSAEGFGGRTKDYRGALQRLSAAIDAILGVRFPPKHLLNLGDIIDGHPDDQEKSISDLDEHVKRLDEAKSRGVDVINVIGMFALCSRRSLS